MKPRLAEYEKTMLRDRPSCRVCGPASGPAPWHVRWTNIDRRLAIAHSRVEVTDKLMPALKAAEGAAVLAFVNAHAMNLAASQEQFAHALSRCDVLLRDGSGLALHLRLRRRSPGLNLNGTDLIPAVIRQFDGQRMALLGTREPFLEDARRKIRSDIAPLSEIDVEHGFHDTSHYVQLALRRRPRLIVLGMGMPKQEHLAVALRQAIDFPCLIVCGGAIIDFLGGKTSRAPACLRRAGLEWTYRLLLEPRRLFRRYVVGNPLFLARSLAHLFLSRRG